MYPWTTPPTSWPAPPQPTTPSSTWPQSSQNAHLFGHPSPLHPTWSSSASLVPSASAPTSLPFTSLTSTPHAVPGPQLVPTMPTPVAPETALVHTAPPTFSTPTAPTAPPTWHSPPATSSPTSTTPPTPLQSSPYPPHHIQPPLPTEASMVPPDEPPPPAVKAAPRLRSDKKTDKPRRSAPKASSPATPSAPTAAPSPSVPPELAALGSTTQQLAESVRLIQAQQQLILDSQRAQEQRQLLLHHDVPIPNPMPPTPLPAHHQHHHLLPCLHLHRKPDPPNLTFRTLASPQLQPPLLLTTYMLHHRQRADHDPGLQDHAPVDLLYNHTIISYSPRRAVRPRSPLPRFRSSTKHDKDRRTPSPYRRRSPPRRRSPVVPRRHRSHPRPRSKTPRHRSRGREVVLRPAARPSNPAYIPTPDADDTWGEWNDSHYTDNYHHNTTRPNSPADPPPPEPSTNPPSHTTAPLGAVSFRVPDGDSENSEVTDAISISKFDTNDIDLSEMVEAANDPLRVRCLTELDPNHTVPLRQSLTPATLQLFNQFVDEMFQQLAQPYRTVNNQLIYIYLYQSKPSHRQEHCQGLCTIQLAGHRACKANQSILHRAREPADHHGPHGIAQETDLSWRAHGHLPDLPQNELGNSCQNPRGRLHSSGNLDKKRSRLPDSIPMLRVLRHVL